MHPRHIVRVVALLVCCFTCRAALADGAEKHDTPKPLPLGSPAPDFKLPGVDGKTYTLHDFDASPVLAIIFTCNHCPTAQLYEERIKKIVDDYKDKGVAVVAINPNDARSVRLDELGYTDLGDTFEEMKVRAKQRKFNFPYLCDGETESASRAYGPLTTPHCFVFDKARKLRYVGRIDDSERPQFVKTHELRDALDALLAGKEPPVTQTKVFGCSVKWATKEDTVKHYVERLANEPVDVEMVDAEGLAALRKNATPTTRTTRTGEIVNTPRLRLVNFWATWCGPCVAEFPELIEINRMYRKRAFELVTVSANYPDEKEAVLKFLKKQQSSGRNLLFASKDKYAMMEAFDPKWDGGLPYTMLISASGEVLYKQQGKIDPLELKRAIVKELKEDRFKD